MASSEADAVGCEEQGTGDAALAPAGLASDGANAANACNTAVNSECAAPAELSVLQHDGADHQEATTPADTAPNLMTSVQRVASASAPPEVAALDAAQAKLQESSTAGQPPDSAPASLTPSPQSPQAAMPQTATEQPAAAAPSATETPPTQPPPIAAPVLPPFTWPRPPHPPPFSSAAFRPPAFPPFFGGFHPPPPPPAALFLTVWPTPLQLPPRGLPPPPPPAGSEPPRPPLPTSSPRPAWALDCLAPCPQRMNDGAAAAGMGDLVFASVPPQSNKRMRDDEPLPPPHAKRAKRQRARLGSVASRVKRPHGQLVRECCRPAAEQAAEQPLSEAVGPAVPAFAAGLPPAPQAATLDTAVLHTPVAATAALSTGTAAATDAPSSGTPAASKRTCATPARREEASGASPGGPASFFSFAAKSTYAALLGSIAQRFRRHAATTAEAAQAPEPAATDDAPEASGDTGYETTGDEVANDSGAVEGAAGSGGGSDRVGEMEDEDVQVVSYEYPPGHKESARGAADDDDVILVAHYQPKRAAEAAVAEAPNFDCIVEVDGSYRRGNGTCAACVFEAHSNETALFPCNLGPVRDNMTSEVEAIVLGVVKAVRLGYRRLRLRSDSAAAVKAVAFNGTAACGRQECLKASARVAHALLNSHHVDFWRIEHIYRAGNKLADSLAGWAHGDRGGEFLPVLSPTTLALERFFTSPTRGPSSGLNLPPQVRPPDAAASAPPQRLDSAGLHAPAAAPAHVPPSKKARVKASKANKVKIAAVAAAPPLRNKPAKRGKRDLDGNPVARAPKASKAERRANRAAAQQSRAARSLEAARAAIAEARGAPAAASPFSVSNLFDPAAQFCFMCGKTGHLFTRCPKLSADPDGGGAAEVDEVDEKRVDPHRLSAATQSDDPSQDAARSGESEDCGPSRAGTSGGGDRRRGAPGGTDAVGGGGGSGRRGGERFAMNLCTWPAAAPPTASSLRVAAVPQSDDVIDLCDDDGGKAKD